MLTARIAIDAAPIGHDMFSAIDYGAVQVFGLTSLPLFAIGATPTPLGAIGVSRDGGLSYRIAIGDHRFADGTRVRPEDYARTIAHLVSNGSHPIRAFLRDLAGFFQARRGGALRGLSIRADELRIELTRPNMLIPTLLSHPAFSPMHPTERRCGAGTYSLPSSASAPLRLTRNPQRPPNGGGVAPRAIEFVLAPDPYQAISAYESGELIATCDTLFPYELFDTHRTRSDFQQLPSEIVAILRVCRGDKPPLQTAAARAALLDRVDRRALSAALGGLATPVSALAAVFEGERPPQPRRSPSSAPLPTGASLTLGYHDFIPNPRIAHQLADQLSSNGLDVRPTPVRYGAATTTDLQLELVYPLFADPFSFYLLEAFRRPLAAERQVWRAYLARLDAYQAADSAATRRRLGAALERELAQHGWMTPLLRMPRMRLCAPGFDDRALRPGSWPVQLPASLAAVAR